MRSILHLALPCSRCGVGAGESCVRLDGKPTSRPHSGRTPQAPCGTYGGYQRHRRHGEIACEACLDANRRYIAERRNRLPEEREQSVRQLRARRRALKRLVSRHREEFALLLTEESSAASESAS